MGVHRLLTYLEQERPNSYCYDVNIKKLAKQFTLETGRTPVIVVDGTTFLYHSAYPLDQNDWMMGGQLAECRANIEAFITAFQKEGIELVFYFDGMTPESKRKVWVERKTQKLAEIVQFFEGLKENFVHSYNYLGKSTLQKQQPPLIGAFGQFMIKYTDGCQLKVSVVECDEEMAAFARREGCFAILAGDTDFVILGAARFFFSSRHLDLARMTTLCYDGKQLARALSLRFDQLPLLATLMGNDFLLSSELLQFHRSLTGNLKDTNQRISKLSNYIRKLPSGDDLYPLLPAIARNLLRNESFAVAMKESLQFYSASAKSAPATRKDTTSSDARIENWNKILHVTKMNHVGGHVPIEIFNIMMESTYELSASLEDTGSQSLPCAAQVYQVLRHRIYSILLREKPGDPAVIKEWCIYPDRPIRKLNVRVEPLPADVDHPGLLILWGKESPGIRIRKWELFAQSVSPLLSSSDIRNLPERHIVPVVVLYFLKQEWNVFKEWEIDAFLSMVVVLGTTPRPQAQHRAGNVKVDSYPPARAVECANLFARGVACVILLMTACGLPLAEAMPWHYFDGKLFLAKYLQAKSGASQWELCHKSDTASKALLKMRSIVLDDG